VKSAISIATEIDPEILLLDEGLGAGDARFAEHAKGRVDDLIERSSILVLASHSEELIRAMCNRVLLLEAGQVATVGGVDDVIATYRRRSAPDATGGRPPGPRRRAPPSGGPRWSMASGVILADGHSGPRERGVSH